MRRSATRAPFVGTSALLLLLAAVPAAQELRFRSGDVLARPMRGGAPRAELVRRLGALGERHVLVRFDGSPSSHERDLWRAAGVELGHPLGDGSYYARVDPDALAGRADRLEGLLDVREIELDWKLDPLLLAGETPSWTVVSVDRAGEQTVAVYALLQRGVALEEGDALLRRLGGSSLDTLDTLNGIVALLPRSRVTELASADEVAWVEAALPRMTGVSMPAAAAAAPAAPNDSNRALTQANTLQAGPYNLDGGGVTVLVYDGGTARSTHVDFGGRLTVRDGSGMHDHPTHVSGTIGGNGSASGGTFRGMAPAVTLESYGLETDGSGIFLFTNPGDFEDDYDEAINVFGADIANNSIGTNTEPNGFICEYQGNYCLMSSLIDGVVRGSLGAPMRVVWANGNERGGSVCDIEGHGDYYSTAPPATAKNHITVGALNSNDDSMTGFSSWGPTDDGRIKPDVSAPGCQSNGDFGVTSATAVSNNSTGAACGTSMASPTVCGLSALIIEDWRVQVGGDDPLNSTLKALLAHTATDRGNAGPDYQFGYGSVRAQAAVDHMRTGRFVEDELEETGAASRFTVTVAPATSELRLTLAWDDAPALPSVLDALVNDLDLVVRDPLGNRHHVWTLNPGNPGANAVRTAADHLNNIEQVLVSSPAAGTWTVEVRGHDVPEGPQLFSLVSSHALVVPAHVRISFPNGLPAQLTPGVSTPVTVRVVPFSDTLVGGSPTLHVRYAGAGFLPLALSSLGGDLYGATLPPAVCTATPEFYFSAQGSTSGVNAAPSGAPSELYSAFVATVANVFVDDFQSNLGWTVTNVSLTGGAWNRAAPGGVGDRCDPPEAFGGSGLCFLTDSAFGNTDVDGGPTRLTSPLIDMSAAGQYQVTYARWACASILDTDSLVVEISSNGGTSWSNVETVTGNESVAGWVEHTFDVASILAPTSQMRMRFSATDAGTASVFEAGLDAFRAVRRTCDVLTDCNANGILDADDVSSGRSNDQNGDQIPDECQPSTGNFKKKGPVPPPQPGP